MGWHGQSLLNAVRRLQEIWQGFHFIDAGRRACRQGIAHIQCAYAVTACTQQISGLGQAVGRDFELSLNDPATPGIRCAIPDSSEKRETRRRE